MAALAAEAGANRHAGRIDHDDVGTNDCLAVGSLYDFYPNVLRGGASANQGDRHSEYDGPQLHESSA
jgi:hypothetical protein